MHQAPYFFFFFFNDTATTEIYTLSLHDALPIFPIVRDTTRTTYPCPYNEHVNSCRTGEGLAVVACSRCVSLADDGHAPAGLLAFVLQLLLEYAPTGIE